MIHTHKSEKQALLCPPKRDAAKMTTCLLVTSIARIQSCSCLLVQLVGGGDSSSCQSLQAADPAGDGGSARARIMS
jgi:hypothetical protein